jgi:hypothetical protein
LNVPDVDLIVEPPATESLDIHVHFGAAPGARSTLTLIICIITELVL